MTHKSINSFLLLTVLTLLFISGSYLYPATYSLFTDTPAIINDLQDFPPFLSGHIFEPGQQDQPIDYQIQQAASVDLNPAIVSYETISMQDTLKIELLNDEKQKAVIDRISVNVNSTLSVRARFIDYDMGYILISTTGERSLAKIHIPETGQLYLIKSDPESFQHYLLDVGEENNYQLESAPPLKMPQTEMRRDELRRRQPETRPGPEDPAFIDVMVLYTPNARDWASVNGGGIENVVAQTMEVSQLTHDNSNTLVELVLVRSGIIDYEEAGDARTDLYRLTFSEDYDPWDYEDGPPWYMEEVHDWRDDYGADLVALLAQVNDVGGIAWQLNTINGRPRLGFSLTRVQQAATGFTFVHELGHNMGCHHNHQQNTSPGPGLFNYSSGWRGVDRNNNRLCTVMTYMQGRFYDDGNNHSRIPFFSTPLIEHQGVQIGDTELEDNSRTLRETKHVVASYRDPVIAAPEARISIDENDSRLISWQSIPIANSYRVYSSTTLEADFEDWEHIATTGETFYLDEAIAPRTLFYRVVASRERIEE